MRLEAAWLSDPDVSAVVTPLMSAGHAVFFVGGCVRNALLNAPQSDIDIATDARPETTMKLARAAGLRAVPTGIDHGTVTVVSGGRGFEITTFRKDVATDGRRAVVAFSDSISEDARRRDFTMNAIYAAPDGTIHDPVGGLPDLRARHIRFIEDPARRIAEDYLRILRFFRFHAWYGDVNDGPDPEALAAIAGGLDGLETLSRERISSEMAKLLAAPDPAPALATMAQTGVLARVLPGADPRALGPLVEIESRLGLSPDWLRRLFALGAEDLPARLRLSKADARRLEAAQTAAALPASEAAYRLGTDAALDAQLVAAATLGEMPKATLPADLAAAAARKFPIRAADLTPALQGPALGEKLRALEDVWIGSGFAMTREDLLGRR